MQKTRQRILEYLYKHGESTIEDLSAALGNLTAVTIRHHLDVLRSEGMVDSPEALHRTTPGRPKYAYQLTSRGAALFPGNLRNLADHMFGVLVDSLTPRQINVIFDGIADSMASDLPAGDSSESPEERLDRVVGHLMAQGYEASWEAHQEGYVLHTHNCPYNAISSTHEEMCQLDMRYISRLLGTVPRRLGHMFDGQDACSYLVTYREELA
jgi:predicted ArsR family transcriptional regulator